MLASQAPPRRRRGLAITAALTGAGLAAVATLAAWNDNAWVFGGTGPDGQGTPGVGTSSFNVVQKAWTGTAPTAAEILGEHETNASGEALVFTANPGALTPGDTVYAPVALRTDDTSVGGSLTLQPAIASANPGHAVLDPDGKLWDTLSYTVRATSTALEAANCTASGFEDAGTPIVTDASLATSIAPGDQTLAAEGGNVQYYCFALTLPATAQDKDLQGRTIFPAWRFAASSAQ